MSIFKACDIRGIYGQDLTDDMARDVAYAVGSITSGKTVVVCGDVRISTPVLQDIFIEMLYKSGCKVIDIGQAATPVFYYALQHFNTNYGVMITASHNPSKYNGFKFALGSEPITEQDIKKIEELVSKKVRCIDMSGSIQHVNILDEYMRFSLERVGEENIKVVIDAGNGATSHIAPALFKKKGHTVVELFCEPDGNFPNRPPNPALAENIEKLGKEVVKHRANLGIAFDGDGDRVGFVNEFGQPIDNDDALILLAGYYLSKQAGTVIYDAKCSMVVPEEIERAGGRPVMARAGHTFARKAFMDEQAVFAGEISGHFFFRELGYDDGMFAGLKMAELVAEHGSLAAMVNAIPNYVITPDIRIPCPESQKIPVIEKALEKLQEYKLNCIDGIRVEMPDGWAMIRPSVTEPLLTFRVEGRTKNDLRNVSEVLLSALPEELAAKVRDEIDRTIKQ